MGVSTGEAGEEVIANMAPFSYAQAAKGQVVNKSQSGSTSSPSSAKDVEELSSMLNNMSTKINWADEVADVDTTEHVRTNGEQVDSQTESASRETNGKTIEDQVSSPDLRASSTSTQLKEDDASSVPTSASESAWDNKSQNSNPVESKTSAGEHKGRGEKGKKEHKEKAPVPKPILLKEAPIPIVNIWAQRAQDIKTKQISQPSSPSVARAGRERSSSTSPIKDAGPERKREELAKSTAARGQGRTSGERPVNASDSQERSKPPRTSSSGVAPSLPLVQDQNSWPTPENAQDEERRKPLERERPAQSGTKPHSKSEWINMPYTPTVKFETPLPSAIKRGGRASGRGGREGGGRGGSSSTGPYSKSLNASETPVDGSAQSRTDTNAAKQQSQLSAKGKNSSENVPHAGNEQDQAIDLGSTASPSAGPAEETLISGPNVSHDLDRATLQAASTPSAEGSLFIPPYKHKSNPTKAPNGTTPAESGEDRSQLENGFSSSRPQWSERKDRAGRSYDNFRESPSSGLTRERTEGRPERGRGGRGGKGGNNQFNAHQQASQQSSGVPPIGLPSPPASKNATPFNTQYHGQPNHYMGPSSRGGYRSGPRAASIPSDVAYARYQSGYQGATMPPYMGTGMYESVGMYPMGSMQPYGEQYLVAETVSTQLGYYFSLDNLLKDTFLRSHMDSQGFVALSLLSNFARMKSLTTDLELIKFVCSNSPELELRTGADGKDRVRKREGWEQWVLPMGERDQAARNDGPSANEQPSTPSRQTYEQYGARMSTGQNEASYTGYHGMPVPFSPIPAASPSGTMQNSTHARHSMSAVDSEVFHHGQTSHGARNVPQVAHSDGDSFPDSQVEFLTVVVRQQNSTEERPTFNSEESRTFSNGSIEGTATIAEMTNGSNEGTKTFDANTSTFESAETKPFDRKRSTASRLPVKGTLDSPVGLFWIKEKESPEPLPSGSTYEPYSHLHMKALQQRQNAEGGVCPYDMDVLYQFWSHFLIRNFNSKMYSEFRTFAHEDASNQDSNTGINNLIKYYSEALSSNHPIRERVARHYIELVNNEDPGKDRPAFKQLRSAWRNGALNIKNRKRVSDLVDAELRSELER